MKLTLFTVNVNLAGAWLSLMAKNEIGSSFDSNAANIVNMYDWGHQAHIYAMLPKLNVRVPTFGTYEVGGQRIMLMPTTPEEDSNADFIHLKQHGNVWSTALRILNTESELYRDSGAIPANVNARYQRNLQEAVAQFDTQYANVADKFGTVVSAKFGITEVAGYDRQPNLVAKIAVLSSDDAVVELNPSGTTLAPGGEIAGGIRKHSQILTPGTDNTAMIINAVSTMLKEA